MSGVWTVKTSSARSHIAAQSPTGVHDSNPSRAATITASSAGAATATRSTEMRSTETRSTGRGVRKG